MQRYRVFAPTGHVRVTELNPAAAAAMAARPGWAIEHLGPSRVTVVDGYATGDRVTAYGEIGTVRRLIPGTEVYAVDLDSGAHRTVWGADLAPADPRVSHVGRPASELTPAELRARRELARRVHARRPMITNVIK